MECMRFQVMRARNHAEGMISAHRCDSEAEGKLLLITTK